MKSAWHAEIFMKLEHTSRDVRTKYWYIGSCTLRPSFFRPANPSVVLMLLNSHVRDRRNGGTDGRCDGRSVDKTPDEKWDAETFWINSIRRWRSTECRPTTGSWPERVRRRKKITIRRTMLECVVSALSFVWIFFHQRIDFFHKENIFKMLPFSWYTF